MNAGWVTIDPLALLLIEVIMIGMTNTKLSQPQRAALARVVLSERQGFGALLPGGRFAVSCRALERAGLVRLDLSRTVEAYLPTAAGLAAWKL